MTNLKETIVRKVLLGLPGFLFVLALGIPVAWASETLPSSPVSRGIYEGALESFGGTAQSFAHGRAPQLRIHSYWEAELLSKADDDRFNGMSESELSIADRARGRGGAMAWKDESGWNIAIVGGVARFPTMSADALQLVLCHELGHLVMGMVPNSIPRNETVADWFAAAVCAPRLWRGGFGPAGTAIDLPMDFKMACQERYSDPQRVEICQRILAAGLRVAQYTSWNAERETSWAVARYGVQPWKCAPPSLSAVAKEIGCYPQCRLDIYRAAALGGPRPACFP